MTKDVLHHEDASCSKDAEELLQVMAHEDTTAQPLTVSDREDEAPSNRSEEHLRSSEIDDCLRELVSRGAIDVTALVEDAKRANLSERRRRWAWGGLAAAGIGAIALSSFLLLQDKSVTHASQDVPRSVRLVDGSEVELNAHSEIEVRFSPDFRDIHLRRGEGLFKARPDKNRPFRVHARKGVFEAVGTQYDVWLAEDHAAVAVVEGTVQYKPASLPSSAKNTPSAAAPRVTAGLSLTVDRDGRAGTPKPIDVVAVTAWRRSQSLVFADVSFATIANAFNQQNKPQKLIIEGEALRARRFSLSLGPDNTKELLTYLEADEDLVITETPDRIVIRERER